ncbi:Beta-lactamase class A [Pseudovibrio ascidiaceicola]|uniref:Beta-lactamase class A n=1 Tax=Pseudovibrio ascidiaceicola TaxID=285279 RepID=A0A1I4EJ08_9HYPH|nr:serine hydrolase [Pseudovibrio ascidiaceicola]SFL05748.1 Beta-lactamase class A [Pseudovibrio ascidiaceicola]
MRTLKEMFLDPILSIKDALENLSPAKRITPEMIALRNTSDMDLLFQLWNGNGEDLSMFTAGFLSLVGEQGLKRSLEDALAAYGAAQEISKETQKNAFLVKTTHFKIVVLLERERSGKIKGLFIRPALYQVEDLDECLSLMQEIVGTSSLLIRKDGVEIFSKNADQPLAIGPAYKLFVMQELVRRVKSGELKWNQKVRLEKDLESHPVSSLYAKMSGGLVTLQVLAQHMMAASDNSAADVVLNLIGTKALETREERAPFLTSRQFYQLKADRALADKYGQADVAKRRKILEKIEERPLPAIEDVADPYLTGVEWYASAEELCDVIGEIADDKAMQFNPGLAEKTDWQRIAFKAGSEIGVLNFTYDLIGLNGTHWQVALTWNHDDILPEGKLLGLTNALLQELKKL